ncbi:Murein DD-endopeptidase MepM and murein hydrolase activator NlpD, contain LysM domain [Thermoactinomyces sp. DSM 45891]|uniref:murein hydrolase activator EnvC family protein n=1 Tax=Thermoactinomyces sp. DSM 45891 TaxID=1761907 RepID=UPI000913BEDC|nr:M23 family metallopeptidase [Thermoactinomyces sp. DSM 45891]SFX22708.1 Murein DD-endopeptidase MepM and murein hydrolase activator NlpD, contain LysM domain [Thermoactinomyces sp. DSM 45891]
MGNKRLVAIAIVCVSVMGTFDSPVLAEKLKQGSKNQQTKLENEKKTLEDEARKQDLEVQQLEQKLDEHYKEMNEQASLLAGTEYKLELQEKKVKNLLRSMYMENYLYPLTQLLDANNLNDFLERYDFTMFFLNEQQRAVTELKEIKQMAQDKKKKLADLGEKQDQVLKETKQKQDELEKKIAQLGKDIRTLKATEDQTDLSERDRTMIAPHDKVAKGSGRYIWPVGGGGMITDTFGTRGGSHKGLDIAAPPKTPILAADSGVVSMVSSGGGYGNCIIISHGGGIQTRYAHISSGTILVKPGQSVSRGQQIAGVGNTGNVRGARGGYHLHFEVMINGVATNPSRYVSR